jgi:hypothetical protein
VNYKKLATAIIAVFIAWEAMDYVIHSLILMDIYSRTANLWRPMEEMKMGLLFVVVLISTISFVLVYALLVKDKSIRAGLIYGAIFGIGTGVSMGYGTYTTMPIPYSLAFGWSLGTMAESIVGGFLVGWLLRD